MAELVPSRPVQVEPGFMIHNKSMAWRPNENLIDGELDNRIPGKVTGCMRFFRATKEPLIVTFDLSGDFHEDIRGKMIRLKNDDPSDRAETLGRTGTYMEGFASMQKGNAGDMTAGRSLGPWTQGIADRIMAFYERSWEQANLPAAEREAMRRELADNFRERIKAKEPYYPYVEYPYVEWFSDVNGRVVLELDDSHLMVIDDGIPQTEKTPDELLEDRRKREEAMVQFLGGVAAEFASQNGKKGNDGDVTSVLVS